MYQHHFQAGHLLVTESLCRPFILLHLCYIILTTITRFLIPSPLPDLPASASRSRFCLPSPLPFHHCRNMLHHLLSSLCLLVSSTLALAHTTPFLFTDPSPSTRRRFRTPADFNAPQRAPRVVPLWLRGGGGGETRDGLVLWDWSMCVLCMHALCLALSALHQRLFSPFTFPVASTRPSSSFASLSAADRSRRLQLSYLCSLLLLLAVAALLFCAYQLHVDAFVYHSPWCTIEAVRVADNWLVMARGGKVRGELERRAKERADEEENAQQSAQADRRELDELAAAAVHGGLHQRHTLNR